MESYAVYSTHNKLFIFKDQPLVVVITVTANNRPYAHPQVDKIMERYLLPAGIKRANGHSVSQVQRLCSVPGVGPVVATTFAATLDEASRFLGAKRVRSYLGLVPREYSSGERRHRGRISKAGSMRARALMVEAA